MRFFKLLRLTTVVLSAMVFASCVTAVDPVEPPPEYSLRSPRYTAWYFQWALEKKSPRHVWNALSHALKAREKLSYSDVELFFDRIEEEIGRYLGDALEAEVVEERPLGPRVRWVTFVSGDHRATIRFVLETTYEFVPAKPGFDTLFKEAASMSKILRYEDDAAILTLPEVPPKYHPNDLERIVIENAWRIDGVVSHNLDELQKAIESRQNP